MRFSEYGVVATTLSNLYENNYYENLCKKYHYGDIMVRNEYQPCCYSSNAYKGYYYFHIDEYTDKQGNKLSKEVKKKIRYKVYKHELYERIKYMCFVIYLVSIMYFSFIFIRDWENSIAWTILGMFLITFLSIIPLDIMVGKHYENLKSVT